MAIESWKPVKNYEGIYKISSNGVVVSLKFNKERIIKPNLTSNGYPKICLSKDGDIITRTIHQLVAEAFLNHTVNGHTLIVDHIDNVKTNNSVDNLQLISCRENLSKDRKGKTSKYTGVSYRNDRNNWQSEIRIDGKRKFLGRFKTELEAHNAYQSKLNEITI